MNGQSRGKNQSFQEILSQYSEVNDSAPYQTGADLGLGLLNELFFAFKRPTRTPRPAPSEKRGTNGRAEERPKAAPERKTRKPLTPAEEAAMAFFKEHGEIEPESLRDLKRAYRRLARRLHPDSQPNANDIEKARLAVKFRQLRQAYLCLEASVTSDSREGKTTAA